MREGGRRKAANVQQSTHRQAQMPEWKRRDDEEEERGGRRVFTHMPPASRSVEVGAYM